MCLAVANGKGAHGANSVSDKDGDGQWWMLVGRRILFQAKQR